jgi:glycerate kinase
VRALACPASLKGVLTAAEAAAALAEGLRTGDADAVELPIGDGGEGTAEALWLARGGDWREADVHDAFGAPLSRTAPRSSRQQPRSRSMPGGSSR